MLLFKSHHRHHHHHRAHYGHGHKRHAIVKVAGKRIWILRGLNSGRILGRHGSRKDALEQLRAVERSMHSD